MDPTTVAVATAGMTLALVLARVIEKLVEHAISKRKNGNGGEARKSALAQDERDMLRSIAEWKDRRERQDQEMIEKMVLISASCRTMAEAVERLVMRVDSLGGK